MAVNARAARRPRTERFEHHVGERLTAREPVGAVREYPRSLLRYPSVAMFLLMREAFRIGQRAASETDDPAEAMRFPHFAVLSCLDEFGARSQREISEHLRMDASDLVALVDWLEQVGFVRRRRDPRDRRRYAVELTARGRRAVRARARVADRLNAELLARLSRDERDRLRQLVLRALAEWL